MATYQQKYQRHTELRHLQSNAVYRLAEILGLQGGRRLMEIIPKHPYATTTTTAKQYTSNMTTNGSNGRAPSNALKYRPAQIQLLEDATHQVTGCHFGELLIQEWSTSGRKHERPTVELLLQLLMQAGLWCAADFVAEVLLQEPAPQRPAVAKNAASLEYLHSKSQLLAEAETALLDSDAAIVATKRDTICAAGEQNSATDTDSDEMSCSSCNSNSDFCYIPGEQKFYRLLETESFNNSVCATLLMTTTSV